ncbi:MAG: metal ABC transporter permease [Spirochaetales bacterium]|nr:metal ABC transporter permease [Spirochaetales bacterium]
MSSFLAALTNPAVPFIRYAFIAGLLGAASFGTVGSLVVVKRITYIAGAISHASLAGLGAVVYLNETRGWSLSPLAGAVFVALLSAFIIARITQSGRERSDTVIGTIWAVGMGIGLLFIARTPGYTDPMSYIFGNILLLQKSDLILITVLDVLVLASVIFFYRSFQAIAFDEEFTRTRGINTGFYETYLILLTALTVVLMVSTVGIVMVIALLTIPAAMSSLFTGKLWHMMIGAVIIGMILNSAGLVISYGLNTPTGSTTIVLAGASYLLLKGFVRRR